MTAWHEVPPPSPGARAAWRAAGTLALLYGAASAVYAWAASFVRDLENLCFEDDAELPFAVECPAGPPPPPDWLVAARWVTWSAGALAILLALVLAAQSSAGRRPVRPAWLAIATAVAFGVAFSALVLVPER